MLSTPSFYFSYTSDLTRSMQSKDSQVARGQRLQQQHHHQDVLEAVSELYTAWDERFVWNRHLLDRFLRRGAEFLRYCVPLVHGAVFIRQCSINGRLLR